MRGHRFYYYATPSDLINVLKEIDSSMELMYHQYNNFKEAEYPKAYRFTSLLEYPEIGYDHSGSGTGEKFMVLPKLQPLKLKYRNAVDGKRIIPDTSNNNPCLMWYLGGVREGNKVTAGQVFTMAESDDESRTMFSQIKKLFKKQFKYYDGYYIGPEIWANRQYRLIRGGPDEPDEYNTKLP